MSEFAVIIVAMAVLYAGTWFALLKTYNALEFTRDMLSKTVEKVALHEVSIDRTMKTLEDVAGDASERERALEREISSIDVRVSEIEEIHLDSMKEQAKQEKLFSDGLENILNYYSSGGEKSK